MLTVRTSVPFVNFYFWCAIFAKLRNLKVLLNIPFSQNCILIVAVLTVTWCYRSFLEALVKASQTQLFGKPLEQSLSPKSTKAMSKALPPVSYYMSLYLCRSWQKTYNFLSRQYGSWPRLQACGNVITPTLGGYISAAPPQVDRTSPALF